MEHYNCEGCCEAFPRKQLIYDDVCLEYYCADCHKEREIRLKRLKNMVLAFTGNKTDDI